MPKEAKSEIQSSISNVDINIRQLELGSLIPFDHHPFHVTMDQDMIELIESISAYGIINPIIVRPYDKDTFQILSGHRRIEACKKLNISTIPALVCKLTTEDATILMVDSNISRMHLLYSEKAFAYRMRLAALNHRGIKKSEWITQYPNAIAKALDSRMKPQSDTFVANVVMCHDGTELLADSNQLLRSDEMLSTMCAESARTIQRYIRLTYLIPSVLQMVDDKGIGFTPAVEISFLRPQEQELLYCVMQELSCTPSVPQARRLKELSQIQPLTENVIYATLKEEKPNQREKFYLQ